MADDGGVSVRLGPITGHMLPGHSGHSWLRLAGWGVSWKDTRRHGLVFSERSGGRPGLQVGAWRLHWLGRGR